MHVLAVNSVTSLLNYLKEQLNNTPSQEQIKALNEAIPEPTEDDDDDEDDDDKVRDIISNHVKLDLFQYHHATKIA